MEFAVAIGLALVLLLMILLFRYQKSSKKVLEDPLPRLPTRLVHRMCPHNNVIQSFCVEQKDSIDEHLDLLAKKLAEKEGRLRLSKSKIRETQHEIDNLHAIDEDVRRKYRQVMDSLRGDLVDSERECRKLQDQIEWVSRRRAEIRDEVRQGQQLYVEAAADLATNLTEMQRGRPSDTVTVTDKPQRQSSDFGSLCFRHRKQPKLPSTSTHGSIAIKSPPCSPCNNPSCTNVAADS